MKKFLLLSLPAMLLLACSSDDSSTGSNITPPVFTGCLASVNGASQLCATQTGRTDLTNAYCDSLGVAINAGTFVPGATFAAVESCPTVAVKECNYSYTETTTTIQYAGRAYFYEGVNSLLSAGFCGAYGVPE